MAHIQNQNEAFTSGIGNILMYFFFIIITALGVSFHMYLKKKIIIIEHSLNVC